VRSSTVATGILKINKDCLNKKNPKNPDENIFTYTTVMPFLAEVSHFRRYSPAAGSSSSSNSTIWTFPISAISNFKDPIMGSLKSSCPASYRSSIETIPLNCLVFDKIAFWRQTNERTNERTDGQQRRFKPQARYSERRPVAAA